MLLNAIKCDPYKFKKKGLRDLLINLYKFINHIKSITLGVILGKKKGITLKAFNKSRYPFFFNLYKFINKSRNPFFSSLSPFFLNF